MDRIKEINYYNGPEKFGRKELDDIFDARVIDFTQTKPQFELLLYKPQPVQFMYGLKRTVSKVVLNVDEPEKFYQEVQNRTGMSNR